MNINITQPLQKLGNGLGVKIPKKVAAAVHILHLNQRLIITLQNGSIVLTPAVDKRTPTLTSMLKGVTPQSIGGELGWNKDVGAERYE